jgi:hypothetical protein
LPFQHQDSQPFGRPVHLYERARYDESGPISRM